jgi:putative selenate reductase
MSFRPYPFGALVRRALREIDARGSLFDLPARRFVGGIGRDLSATLHGRRAATPFGPAAGPHTQLAQNIVLAWAAGGRTIELKTVQVRDDLDIPRPCIDVATVGYNVEWSQELRLDQSLEEYVKAGLLIRILTASGLLPLEPGFEATLFDVSLGYDLAGIRGPRVGGFLDGIRDTTRLVDRLRGEIPQEFRRWRDVDVPTALSESVTLSTFHGCPPGEIEAIARHLLEERRLHCVIKLNPTLLGPADTRGLLHDALGYEDLRVPDEAFANDPTWAQMIDVVGRLALLAERAGLGFGVKLTNTLVVENHRDFFPPTERIAYLSGPPLHVLAAELVRRVRRTFGSRIPVSFSAGIDAQNFPDALALGLAPVTVCTDLLKPGGYGRAHGYFRRLGERMAACGAGSLPDLIIRAHGRAAEALDRLGADGPTRTACLAALRDGTDLRGPAGILFERWVAEASVLNADTYADRVASDPRYAHPANARGPRHLDRRLRLFDCISCDKCVPVCPNDANFTFEIPRTEVPIVKLVRAQGAWHWREEGTLAIEKDHQIGNFADFCNDCGNCDVFCPEEGRPYEIKPRFFGRADAWQADAPHDGFFTRRADGVTEVLARVGGLEYRLLVDDERTRYAGPGFDLAFQTEDVEGTIDGHADDDRDVDFTYYHIMRLIADGVHAPQTINFVNCLS